MFWLAVLLLALCSACPYNPAFHFTFDEPSPPYYDSIGAVNYFPANPAYVSVPGMLGNAAYFSAATNGVPTLNSISISAPGSLAFWIRINSSKGEPSSIVRILGWDGDHEFGLSSTPISPCPCAAGRLYPELFNSGYTGNAIPADIFDKWSFISMSQASDGSHVAYVDGRQLMCSISTPAPTSSASSRLYLGNRPGTSSSDGLVGAIDDLRWWDQSLTESQHMALYQSCAPGSPTAAPAIPCRAFGTPAPPLPLPVPAPLPRPLPLPAPAPRPLPVPAPRPSPLPFPLPVPSPFPSPLPSPLPAPLPSPEASPSPSPLAEPHPAPSPLAPGPPEPAPYALPMAAPSPSPLPAPEPQPLPQPQPQPQPSCIFANAACNGSQIIGTVVVVSPEPVVVTTTLEILGDLYLNGQALNFQLNPGGQTAPLIQVQGCAVLDGTLTLDLTGIDVSTLDGETYDLITSLCTTGTPNLNVTTNSSACEDVSATGATTGGTYTVTLHVDTSCSEALQTWQIALAAIGGFVVLVVLGLVVYLLCQPRGKEAEDEALEFELTASEARLPEVVPLGPVLEAAEDTERSVRNLLNSQSVT